MKKLFLSLLAVGFLAIAPATSLASNSNIVATNCPNGGKKVDAKAFTNKLVKELKLNKKQAAELLKLNNEYADILVCPKQKTDCKKAESCCKKNEASHCDKQAKYECKSEAGSCCKQAKPECKGEANHCDKQAKAECPKRMCEMKTKRNAYLEGLKKILTDKQYQQFMKM